MRPISRPYFVIGSLLVAVVTYHVLWQFALHLPKAYSYFGISKHQEALLGSTLAAAAQWLIVYLPLTWIGARRLAGRRRPVWLAAIPGAFGLAIVLAFCATMVTEIATGNVLFPRLRSLYGYGYFALVNLTALCGIIPAAILFLEGLRPDRAPNTASVFS